MPGAGLSRKRLIFAGLAVAGVAMLLGLGVWQLQRRAWKHDLIARVAERTHAAPMPAPGSAPGSPRFDAQVHEYRAVKVSGRFHNERETLVQAATRLGGGFWVMTPLTSDAGVTVLVNRGFIDSTRRAARSWSRIEGPTTVTGLLRLSEPAGGFLRDNQPSQDRWYSRDVNAIAHARGMAMQPYFIDAAADPRATDAILAAPVAGLTVLSFNDNHLQYALTWFALALLLGVGAFRLYRHDRSLGKLSAQ